MTIATRAERDASASTTHSAANLAPSGDGGLRRSDAVSNTDDVLNYLADMLAELKDLADDRGCATLAGILDVAQREASLQRRPR